MRWLKERYLYNISENLVIVLMAEGTNMSGNPKMGNDVKIAEGAVVKGNVTIGDESSIWYNAVIRCEETSITIGHCSNIQDNAVLHVDPWNELTVGDYVTVGHGAILHGCSIGNNTLIGMGAIVMNGAVVGDNCIIGAGALITEGTVIGDNCLVIGSPGKVARKIMEADEEKIRQNAEHYVEFAKKYL